MCRRLLDTFKETLLRHSLKPLLQFHLAAILSAESGVEFFKFAVAELVEATELVGQVWVCLQFGEFGDGFRKAFYALDCSLDLCFERKTLAVEAFVVFAVDAAEFLVEGRETKACVSLSVDFVADKAYPFGCVAFSRTPEKYRFGFAFPEVLGVFLAVFKGSEVFETVEDEFMVKE